MTYRRIFAALAAIITLGCNGCSAKQETAVMTNDAPAAVQEEAAGAAADKAEDAADEGGEAVYDVRTADADDADVAAEADMDSVAAPGAFSSSMLSDGASAEAGCVSYGAVDEAAIEAKPGSEAVTAIESPIEVVPTDPGNLISVLTAGEWSDHANWGFFSNLVNTGVISFPSFGLEPTQRIAVTVRDESGAPAANVKVLLLDDARNPIWTAVTGKDGIAYLFETKGRKAEGVMTEGAGEAVSLPPVAGEQQGDVPQCSDRAVELTVAAAPAPKTNTQIMFIVDTTGSMGDEMLYLQSDFATIAQEAGDAGTEYAALFYKDEHDEYVTRTQGFTADVGAIGAQLSGETATGGGDEPEAVAPAFSEAFCNTEWREDAVKIAFLIYDAPPHSGTDDTITAAVESAAAQGIHLVPVVSSNGSRETELFGRACAIMTNGDYVFLTDDSGVGGSHLEPIIGDHAVEKLHDIIVRIIANYKQ